MLTLHQAAAFGDIERLKELLSDPSTDVNQLDDHGKTALQFACFAQQPGAVALLMNHPRITFLAQAGVELKHLMKVAAITGDLQTALILLKKLEKVENFQDYIEEVKAAVGEALARPVPSTTPEEIASIIGKRNCISQFVTYLASSASVNWADFKRMLPEDERRLFKAEQRELTDKWLEAEAFYSRDLATGIDAGAVASAAFATEVVVPGGYIVPGSAVAAAAGAGAGAGAASSPPPPVRSQGGYVVESAAVEGSAAVGPAPGGYSVAVDIRLPAQDASAGSIPATLPVPPEPQILFPMPPAFADGLEVAAPLPWAPPAPIALAAPTAPDAAAPSAPAVSAAGISAAAGAAGAGGPIAVSVSVSVSAPAPAPAPATTHSDPIPTVSAITQAFQQLRAQKDLPPFKLRPIAGFTAPLSGSAVKALLKDSYYHFLSRVYSAWSYMQSTALETVISHMNGQESKLNASDRAADLQTLQALQAELRTLREIVGSLITRADERQQLLWEDEGNRLPEPRSTLGKAYISELYQLANERRQAALPFILAAVLFSIKIARYSDIRGCEPLYDGYRALKNSVKQIFDMDPVLVPIVEDIIAEAVPRECLPGGFNREAARAAREAVRLSGEQDPVGEEEDPASGEEVTVAAGAAAYAGEDPSVLKAEAGGVSGSGEPVAAAVAAATVAVSSGAPRARGLGPSARSDEERIRDAIDAAQRAAERLPPLTLALEHGQSVELYARYSAEYSTCLSRPKVFVRSLAGNLRGRVNEEIRDLDGFSTGLDVEYYRKRFIRVIALIIVVIEKIKQDNPSPPHIALYRQTLRDILTVLQRDPQIAGLANSVLLEAGISLSDVFAREDVSLEGVTFTAVEAGATAAVAAPAGASASAKEGVGGGDRRRAVAAVEEEVLAPLGAAASADLPPVSGGSGADGMRASAAGKADRPSKTGKIGGGDGAPALPEVPFKYAPLQRPAPAPLAAPAPIVLAELGVSPEVPGEGVGGQGEGNVLRSTTPVASAPPVELKADPLALSVALVTAPPPNPLAVAPEARLGREDEEKQRADDGERSVESRESGEEEAHDSADQFEEEDQGPEIPTGRGLGFLLREQQEQRRRRQEQQAKEAAASSGASSASLREPPAVEPQAAVPQPATPSSSGGGGLSLAQKVTIVVLLCLGIIPGLVIWAIFKCFNSRPEPAVKESGVLTGNKGLRSPAAAAVAVLPPGAVSSTIGQVDKASPDLADRAAAAALYR